MRNYQKTLSFTYILISVYSPVIPLFMIEDRYLRFDQYLFPLIVVIYILSKLLTPKFYLIESLWLVLLIHGTVLGIISGNNILNMVAMIESYFYVIFAFYLFKIIIQNNWSYQAISFICKWLVLPYMLLFVMNFIDPQMTKNLLEIVFWGRTSNQWRFSATFELPYIAAVFLGTLLYLNMFILKYKKNNDHYINWLVVVSIIILGIATTSKTFVLSLIIFVFAHLYLRKLWMVAMLLFCIMSVILFGNYYGGIYARYIEYYSEFNLLSSLYDRYSSSDYAISYLYTLYSGFDFVVGRGFGANQGNAVDSFYMHLILTHGIIITNILIIILTLTIIKIFIDKNYYLFFTLLFLSGSALGSFSFVNNRSELVIWISMLLMYSMHKQSYNYRKLH